MNMFPNELTPEQCTFFDDQGYVKVEKVLQGEQLARVQQASYRVEEETQEEWQRTIVERPDYRPYQMCETAQVVFPVAPYGDIFVDLLEHPRTISIAAAFMGPDMQMSDNALHVKPAGTKSHVAWHWDETPWFYPEAEGWGEEDRQAWERIQACQTPFLQIKIFFFVEDVDEDTAPFSVVPGSHKFDRRKDGIPRYDDLTDMPDHVRLVGNAGDAILWNGSIWHCAMDNTGAKARRMLLFNYTHFGLEQHQPCIPTGAFVDYVRQRSPLCRQLFGLERMPGAMWPIPSASG